jgi:chlorophyllide a reductase subunit Z
LGTELDKIEATLGRASVESTIPWEPEAQDLLDALLEQQPVLVRISAAKRFRDQAERDARETGRSHVQAERFAELFGQSTTGVHA